MKVGMDLLTLQVAFALEKLPLRNHSSSVWGDSGKSMRLGVRGRFLADVPSELLLSFTVKEVP